jgi:hypothetical protein
MTQIISGQIFCEHQRNQRDMIQTKALSKFSPGSH